MPWNFEAEHMAKHKFGSLAVSVMIYEFHVDLMNIVVISVSIIS